MTGVYLASLFNIAMTKKALKLSSPLVGSSKKRRSDSNKTSSAMESRLISPPLMPLFSKVPICVIREDLGVKTFLDVEVFGDAIDYFSFDGLRFAGLHVNSKLQHFYGQSSLLLGVKFGWKWSDWPTKEESLCI